MTDEELACTRKCAHVVGGDGVMGTIPLSLDAGEREGLRRSAGILREALGSLGGSHT